MHFAASTIRFVVIAFNAVTLVSEKNNSSEKIPIIWLLMCLLTQVAGILTATLCGLAINSLHHEHLSYCIFGIVVGTLAFVVALTGCLGAKRESIRILWAVRKSFTWEYSILMIDFILAVYCDGFHSVGNSIGHCGLLSYPRYCDHHYGGGGQILGGGIGGKSCSHGQLGGIGKLVFNSNILI